MEDFKIINNILEIAVDDANKLKLHKMEQTLAAMRSLDLPNILEIALTEFIYRHMYACIDNSKEKTLSVYFIKSRHTGLIKIGQTSAPVEERLQGIRGMCPGDIDLMASVKDEVGDLENKLHIRFKEYRCNGEWFSPAEEILEYIQKSKKQ